ncbi:MAG: DUF5916 domain-containing protein [Gemmatimonadaceae bacterium]
MAFSALTVVLAATYSLAPMQQTVAANDSVPLRKEARAQKARPGAVRLDGRLEEAVWRGAHFVSDFIQKAPVENTPPTERTEVAFLYDANALYVGARMYSHDPSNIQASLSRRDRTHQSEHVWISLDTYRDRRTAYSFGITATGVRMDFYHPTDHERDVDESFDPVWEARAVIDSLGWTAEFRIPFSQLRFNARASQLWGLNINRWIPSRNEDVFWVYIPKSETGWSSRMGELVGIEGIEPSRRIELLPYVASSATRLGDRDPRNPLVEAWDAGLRVGGDLKMGLGPNLTLDATINPDFGQVELDPSEVNLSAFETFFEERRPFFIEGSHLLQGRGAGYFYSRRIGQQPRGSVGGDFVDRPQEATILGAAKLTGRLASGASLGVLAAVTDREHAHAFDTAARRTDRVRVAPLAAYAVARGQQEFGRDASTVGAILTAVRRDLSPSDPLSATYTRQAFSGGVDWNLRFARGMYQLDGHVGMSHVEGDSSVIARLQRSSVRYFQRPDADHVRYDPTRTSLTGATGSLGLSKQSGKHWLWTVFGDFDSPSFEINDAGRLSASDGIFGFANVRYRETVPGHLFRSYELGLNSENEWNSDFDRQFAALRSDAELAFLNHWELDLRAWIDFRAQNQRLTRGGPSMGMGQAWVTIARLSNSFAAATRWSGRVYYGRSELGEKTYRLSGGLTVRPTPRWELSIEPNYLRSINPRQFIATESRTGGDTTTYGNRYVFAFTDRATFQTEFRLNYTMAPDLSFELYAVPFAASGRFYNFGELERARSRELRFYGARGGESEVSRLPDGSVRIVDRGDTLTYDNPDFNVRALRSNAVLRWEWRPGSTLFVVWQQDRGADESSGRLVRPGDLFDALTATGNHYFAVKATFWLPIP